VDLGVEHEIIGKSGAWYSYQGAKIAQGREAAKSFLADNPEVALEIEKKIKDRIKGVEEPDEEVTAKDLKKKPELAASTNGKKK